MNQSIELLGESMPIHDFDFYNEKFSTIDKIVDPRTEAQKRLTPLSLYNHDKSDIALAERLAEEAINISGAWVSLHLRLPKNDDIQDPSVLWSEDADPIYDTPKDFKAWVKPEAVEQEMLKYGVDQPIKATIVFARAVMLGEIGERLMVPGDVIEIPYNIPSFPENPRGPKYFRVLNVSHTGYYQYRWLYIECDTELITGDDALRPVLRGLNRGMPNVG